jgi:hypothetical protein
MVLSLLEGDTERLDSHQLSQLVNKSETAVSQRLQQLRVSATHAQNGKPSVKRCRVAVLEGPRIEAFH